MSGGMKLLKGNKWIFFPIYFPSLLAFGKVVIVTCLGGRSPEAGGSAFPKTAAGS